MMIKKVFFTILLSIIINATLQAGFYYSSEYGWSWRKVIVKATAKEQLEYCQEFESKKDYSTAQDHYAALIKVFVKGPEVNEAFHRIGELFILQKNYNAAQKYFDKLLKRQIKLTTEKYATPIERNKRSFLNSKKRRKDDDELMFQILLKNLDSEKDANSLVLDIPRILKNLYAIGDAYLDGNRFKLFGMIPLWKQRGKGEKLFTQLLKRAPSVEYAPKMRFKIAMYYFKRKDYLEAILEFKKLSYEYSLSEEAKLASYFIGVSHYKFYKGPGYNEENLTSAEANFQDYILSNPFGDKVALAKEYLEKMKAQKAETMLIKIKFFIRRKQWRAAGIYIKEIQKQFSESSASKEAELIKLKYDKIIF